MTIDIIAGELQNVVSRIPTEHKLQQNSLLCSLWRRNYARKSQLFTQSSILPAKDSFPWNSLYSNQAPERLWGAKTMVLHAGIGISSVCMGSKILFHWCCIDRISSGEFKAQGGTPWRAYLKILNSELGTIQKGIQKVNSVAAKYEIRHMPLLC